MKIKIGTIKTKKISHCPSYYAADWENLHPINKEEDLYLVFETGYVCPMPYWLISNQRCQRIAGATYSGLGGVNFASRPLPLEEVEYNYQDYAYRLRDLLDSGEVTLTPEFSAFAKAACRIGKTAEEWHAWLNQLSWETLRQMSAE